MLEAGFVVLFAGGAFGIEEQKQVNAMQDYGADGSRRWCIAAASWRPGAAASPGLRAIAAARPGLPLPLSQLQQVTDPGTGNAVCVVKVVCSSW